MAEHEIPMTTTVAATNTVTTTSDEKQQQQQLIQQNDACLRTIELDVKKTQPLTSDRVPILDLVQHYQEAPNFQLGVRSLASDYSSLRMIRGDGNCYYRAFLYSLVEHIILSSSSAPTCGKSQTTKPAVGPTILNWLKTDSWARVLSVGYEEMTLEIFYDAMVDLLERVVQGALSLEEFHAELNQETCTSDYCTWYMRVITAAHLKSHPDRFLPFIMGESDYHFETMDQFCQRHVEPMGQECEMVQALALAEAFRVQVQIEYLDGHALREPNGKLVHHVVGATDEPPILKLTLLYRPGHYDILYPLESNTATSSS